MLINITVPGYSTCIPLNLDTSVPLQSYSWVDIIACNIVNNPDLEVTINCIECDGKELDCKKSLTELGLSESACICVKITTQTLFDIHNKIKQVPSQTKGKESEDFM